MSNNADRMEKGRSVIPDFHTIHQLVEFVSEKLNNPVTIESPNFELVSYSGNPGMLDSARRDTILGKRVPDHIVEQLKNQGVVALIEKAASPIRIDPMNKIGLSQRVVIGIRYQNKVLGSFWVQETNQRLSEKQFQFLEEASKMAARLLTRQNQLKTAEAEAKDRVYTRLLQGDYKNERAARMEAEIAGVTFPELHSVIVFALSEDKSHFIEPLKRTIRTYCIYTSKTTYWLEQDEKVVVIVGSPSIIEFSSIKLAQRLVQNVKKILDQEILEALDIGIGTESDQVMHIKKSYEEALEVLHLKRVFEDDLPDKYDHLGVFRLLPEINKRNKMDRYVNKTIQKLDDYDRKNQTDFLNTLKHYIRCNCRTKETAETLFIHPNTLNYRMKRISEICNIDFEDINERTILYIDLLLKEYNSSS